MIEIDVKLTLKVQGPFLSRSSSMGGFGVDAVALRQRDGFPLLPGSQVRGRLREALIELYPADALDFLAAHLGPVVDRGAIGSDEMRPRPWYFEDFTTDQFQQTSPYDGLLTRIALDENTGSVNTGSMLVAECAIPPGGNAEFTGKITLTASDEADALDQLKRVTAAAHWVPSVGSFRSVGFGRVTAASLTIVEIRDWSPVTLSMNYATWNPWLTTGTPIPARRPSGVSSSPASRPASRLLTVQMETPFCVGGRRRDRNVYRSLNYLTGAVLKGAVAQHLRRILGLGHRQNLKPDPSSGSWNRLRQHYNDIRFLTAFPTKYGSTVRPIVDPLSLVKSDSDDVRDVARLTAPFLVKSVKTPERWIAPTFAIDWKSNATSGWHSGRVEPIKELRLHTAIDAPTRRAKDEHLFAHEVVHSITNQGDSVVFQGQVTLPPAIDASAQAMIWDELESLFDVALFRIGKTKARARFQLSDPNPDPKQTSSTSLVDDRWVIVLQSPALILDPNVVHEDWNDGLDRSEDLYAEYFQQISGNSIKLVNQFRDESLQGGFLAHRTGLARYQPFLVTEPGTVFVLQPAEPGKQADAQKMIDRWLASGLDQPEWAITRYGSAFSSNPFLPQDGFGEIAVNIPAQLSLAINESEFQTR